jgi:hypothetical protein
MRETQNSIGQTDKLVTYLSEGETSSSNIQIPVEGVEVREIK